MIPVDDFTKYYSELLESSYDCIDRIVLRAYCSLLQGGGGFRLWWRQTFGSEDSLDKNHLLRMAGRFSRRMKGWCTKKRIPLIYCKPGERKHNLAKQHLPKDENFTGCFLVTISKMVAPTYQVSRNASGVPHLDRCYRFVNHYGFHIIDPLWGHITILISGHPPFNCLVILNGHEWVARTARKNGLCFTKSDNCFVELPNAEALNQTAETLNAKRSVGRLRSACQRWIYFCLSFGLSLEEQRRSRFCYSFSLFQVEYSRNLIFQVGKDMQQVFEGLIDRSRSLIDLRKVTTWFGFKQRPQKRKLRKQKHRPQFGCTVETLEYNLTVFKVHWGKLTLKVYSKGERVLRIEAIAHNVKELRCGCILERFELIISQLQAALVRFLDALHCIDITLLDGDTIEDLSKPAFKGERRLAGVDLQKPRTRLATEALASLSLNPRGFTAADLVAKLASRTQPDLPYGPRQASYDLRKFAGKELVKRIPKSRRYNVVLPNLQKVIALLLVNERVLKPLAASCGDFRHAMTPRHPSAFDLHIRNLREHLRLALQEIKVAA